MDFLKQFANLFTCCFKQPSIDIEPIPSVLNIPQTVQADIPVAVQPRQDPILKVPVCSPPADELLEQQDPILDDDLDDPLLPPPDYEPDVLEYLKDLNCGVFNEEDEKSGRTAAVHFIRTGSQLYPDAPDQDLVLKVTDFEAFEEDLDEELARVYRKEVDVYQRIEAAGGHPNIVRFYGAVLFGFNRKTGAFQHRPYVVTKDEQISATSSFIPFFGGMLLSKCDSNLEAWSKSWDDRTDRRTLAVDCRQQVGDGALRFLHDKLGIVHMDLYAHNIGLLLGHDRPTYQLYDFGLSAFPSAIEDRDRMCADEKRVFDERLQEIFFS